jgi:cellulose synthase/poly-beta-1,6-N-acetylglucosamine synthase-like glycosyltransferase
MVLTPSLLCLMIVAFFALLQLFYYLFFFARLAFYKKKIPTLHTPNEPISIIICAFNEEANLRKNLPIWLGQQYHKDGKPILKY